MRIMAIADHESQLLWDYFDKSRLEGIDLILSSGDLKPQYLSFLATFTHAPILYVRGNHDERYKETPPDGCICIEDKIYVHEGVRILGLGGSMRYKPGDCQYSQFQMARRVMKLQPKLMWHKGFDILLAHSPAFCINDGDDLPHTGFKVFNYLLDHYAPRYFIHGHVHLNYGPRYPRLDLYNDTTIINAHEKYVFDYEDPEHLPQF